MRKLFVFLALFLLGSGAPLNKTRYDLAERVHRTAPGYDIFCVGACNRDANSSVRSGMMMMGGATDVDEAFEWLIDNSGGGDIVVLRTSGTDAYNDYIYGLGDCASVTTIIIKLREGANTKEVEDTVRKAEALFITGGDQSSYVNMWKDTNLDDAIHYLINTKKVTVGGTSAGLHVQGDYVYTGETGGVYSDEALENPYNQYMTFAFDFISLPNARDIITDSHFLERDRMGRLVTFLARLIQDGESGVGVKGIAVSEETALLVDSVGYSYRVGEGPVYLMRATERPSVCRRATPLTMESVLVYKLDKGTNNGTFNILTWSGKGGREYYVSAVNGKLSSTQIGGSVY